MAKNFFSINWQVMLCDIAKVLGFTSESALNYAKGAKNHHHAMTMVNILQRGGWCELLLPYVRQRMSEDFLYQWMREKNSTLYTCSTNWTYIGAIQVYHMGITRNNCNYVNAGQSKFAPTFSTRLYTSKYQLIELSDR